MSDACVRAISKELPALTITLQNLYESSGDAEAYGLAIVLRSFSGVATVFLLRSVLHLLAKLNCYMQRKSTDFSKLPIILQSVISEMKELKKSGSTWSCSTSATTTSEFCNSVAAPYIDALVSNINSRFSDGAVKLLVSSSIFNPSAFPTEKTAYGNKELQVLLDF